MDRRKFLKTLFIGSVALSVGAKGLKEILTKELESEAPTRLSENVRVLGGLAAEEVGAYPMRTTPELDAEFTRMLSKHISDEMHREVLRMFV